MPLFALGAFTAEYGGDTVEIALGERVADDHELAQPKAHVRHIFEKLGVASRTQAILASDLLD